MEGNASEVEDTKPDTEVDDTNDTCTTCSEETREITEAIEDSISSTDKPDSTTDRDGNFEPRLIAFCCNWCSYAGADLAGVSRLQYPSNIRIIRVMCSGRIEPQFVLRALELGADGILVTAIISQVTLKPRHV